jgi:hypothetical protein
MFRKIFSFRLILLFYFTKLFLNVSDINDYFFDVRALGMGCRPRETLQNLCDQIPGDALLYSMFKVDAEPIKCPIRGKNSSGSRKFLRLTANSIPQDHLHSPIIVVMASVKIPFPTSKAVRRTVECCLAFKRVPMFRAPKVQVTIK